MFFRPFESFLERIKAAKQDGFDGIECHWPYNTPSEKVHNVLKETGLPIIGINTNPGNLEKGFFGFSALPQYAKKAKNEINMSIKYGINIGIKNLHVMAGNIPKTKYAQITFCDNLSYACNLANKHKLNILIEPLLFNFKLVNPINSLKGLFRAVFTKIDRFITYPVAIRRNFFFNI